MVYDASREKIDLIYLLKINIHYCLDSSLYRAIYRCIVIHQRQYIDTSTHCIVATLTRTHTHTRTYTHIHIHTQTYNKSNTVLPQSCK